MAGLTGFRVSCLKKARQSAFWVGDPGPLQESYKVMLDITWG
jgi:hypothetical protein